MLHSIEGTHDDPARPLMGDAEAPSPTVSTPQRPRARRRFRTADGQAVVEFALVLPLLMLLILGIIKGGILYNNYLSLTDSVRSGARDFSIERGQTDPCGDTAAAVVAARGGLAQSNLTLKLTESTSGSIYTYTNSAGSGTCPTLTSGSAVTVDGTYPCDFSLMGINIIPSCQIHVSATEQVE